MHEGDTRETSRLKERDESQAHRSSVGASESEEQLMCSVETKGSTPEEKPSVPTDGGTPPRIARKRVFEVLHVVTAVCVAALSYYVGTLRVHERGEQTERPQMIVETLWATPLARTHLRTHPSALNLSAFNGRLADAVAEDYAAFRAQYSDRDASEVNDLFFEHQVGAPGEKKEEVRARVEGLAHRQLGEFRVVARCAAKLAERLIERFGGIGAEGKGRRLQGWATLHDGSSRHGLHVHAESTLSVVYYVRMGEGGALRLYDPRGPRPPFEGSVEIWPEEGEMVAFPGWVAHEVEVGTGRRVSLVFNVPGNWEGEEFGAETVGLGRWGAALGRWKLDFGDGVL